MRGMHARPLARVLFGGLLGSLLAACTGGSPPPASSSSQMQQEARLQVGDTVLRANAIPTLSLGEAVARQYGIARDGKTVLLLVSLRRGPEAQETSLQASVAATATDLLGKKQTIAMREIRSGEFVDYVGSAQVIPPDTLHFAIQARPQDGSAMTLQFNRDFFP